MLKRGRAMVMGMMGSFTDGNPVECDTRNTAMKVKEESAATVSNPEEKTAPATLANTNSDDDKNVDMADSIYDENETPSEQDKSTTTSQPLSTENANDNFENDKNASDSDDSDGSSTGDDCDTENDSDSDSDSDNDKPGDGISAYERLRIERIRRNEERLKQLGLVDPSKKLQPLKRKKRVSVGGSRKKDHVPQRSQPKRSAKTNMKQGGLLSGSEIDLRTLRQSYKGRFGSQKKTKTIPDIRYSKRYRCGECWACKREDDCQTCPYCSFNSRQGSSSTCRRRCLFRMCVRRLIDVEVEVEPETEEKKNTGAEAPANESAVEDSTEINKKIGNDGSSMDLGEDPDNGDATVADKIETNVDKKVDEDEEAQKQIPSLPKSDANVETSTTNSDCVEKNVEDLPNKIVPIEDSDYFASYRMEESDSGLPKWLDEFHEFMGTIPHGPMNRVSGQKNLDNTMSQICKLVSGEGVTYHLWPEGTHFKRGIKIHLGMDLSALYHEAVTMERQYEDRRKGSLLRHPIAKMICYKEWIANGKPTASKVSPVSPLLALPPPTIDNDNNKEESKKRVIAMTIEQQIKPNRISWASDVAQLKVDNMDVKGSEAPSEVTTSTVQNETEKIKTSESVEERCKSTGMKLRGSSHKESSIDDESATTNDNDNHAKNEKEISQGDENEEKEELVGESIAPVSDESSSRDKQACRVPSACSLCLEGGDLICCDGCNSGFHSNCHFPKIKEIPMGEWFCKDCTRKKNPQWSRKKRGPKREVVVNQKLFQGEHADDCYMCYLGGDLICCDFCEKAYHLKCHIPPLPFVPEGIWKCCECLAVERTRKSRCGECEACTRDDCGQCKHCLDKPKFGGSNKLRQVCIKKACPYSRFAPPASSTTVPGTVRKRGRPRKSLNDDAMTNGSGRKRGRPRKSVANDYLTTAETKRKRGRPRKSVDNSNSIVISDPTASITKRRRGRPRKSVDGDMLEGNRTPAAKTPTRKRGRPRKSVDGDRLEEKKSPATTPTRKRGRPRKSVSGDNLEMDSPPIASTPKRKRGRPRKSLDVDTAVTKNSPETSTTKKKRGRPRKSADSGEINITKRVKVEADDEDSIIQPVVFRFKISSFKSAYNDSESVKIRKIIKSAIRDPSDSKTVDKACERLRKCMKSVESVKTALLFGAVEMLCNAMRDHPDKSILQAEACCTLAEMLWIFPGISTKLAHMNAIDLIVDSLHRCSNNSKMQQMGCGALGAFSYDETFTKQIIDAGGLQAVEAAMERFPKKEAVLMEGCYFFQNLIARSVDALRSVSNSQVVPIIVEAMSNEDVSKDILLPMFGLIANLAVDKEAKEFIGQSDAISATIAALHADYDAEVKQAACTVLKNLAIGSSGNQTKIAENGGLDALFDAMHSHPDDALLLILSFTVMKELCIDDEDIAHEIVSNGGIKIILKAMQKNNDLATMQVAACGIIGYIILEGKSEMHAPKLVKAILTAMKNHSEDSDVQIQACDALFELSQISTTRLILKKKETQELLLRAKSRFKSCESDVDDIIAASEK